MPLCLAVGSGVGGSRVGWGMGGPGVNMTGGQESELPSALPRARPYSTVPGSPPLRARAGVPGVPSVAREAPRPRGGGGAGRLCFTGTRRLMNTIRSGHFLQNRPFCFWE